jgi:hypothetical protein
VTPPPLSFLVITQRVGRIVAAIILFLVFLGTFVFCFL